MACSASDAWRMHAWPAGPIVALSTPRTAGCLWGHTLDMPCTIARCVDHPIQCFDELVGSFVPATLCMRSLAVPAPEWPAAMPHAWVDRRRQLRLLRGPRWRQLLLQGLMQRAVLRRLLKRCSGRRCHMVAAWRHTTDTTRGFGGVRRKRQCVYSHGSGHGASDGGGGLLRGLQPEPVSVGRFSDACDRPARNAAAKRRIAVACGKFALCAAIYQLRRLGRAPCLGQIGL